MAAETQRLYERIAQKLASDIARGQYNTFNSAKTLDDREAAGARGKSLAGTADGLFIAGGVIAAVGIVLLIVPAVRKSRAAQALQDSTYGDWPSLLHLGVMAAWAIVLGVAATRLFRWE